MNRSVILAALAAALPSGALAQTTLQSDDGTMESMWSLTSPNAGPGDWVGVSYAPPIPFPFRIVSASMFYLDTYCCSGNTCSDALCVGGADWERMIIAQQNLAVDPAGLTPNIALPIAEQTGVAVASGSNRVAPPWTLTPHVWTLPAGTIFDAPGRVFFAIKYFDGDQWMRFAVDASSMNLGTSIHTSDNFSSRASIWAFGNVGMRVVIEPIFHLRAADAPPAPGYQLAGATGVPMLAFRIGAGTSATTVQRVRITGSGTGNEATGVAAVRLILDANGNGAIDAGELTLSTGAFTTNDGTVDLNLARTLAAGTSERWLVAYDFTSTPLGGQTFAARVALASDVLANTGAPYLSGAITGNAATIAGRLSLELGPSSMAPQIVPAQAQSLATLQVRLRAMNEAFELTGLTLTAGGTLNDPAGVGSVRLYADADSSGTLTAADALLGSGTFPADDGRRSFTFAARTVPANGTLDLIAVYDLTALASGGTNFRTLVAAASDVVASGVSSGAIPVTGPRVLTGLPIIGNLGTVGGALTAALGPASPAAGTAQPATIGVPMLQLVLGAAAEPISVGAIRFSSSGSGDETLDVTRAELWRDQNQNGIADAGDVRLGSPSSFTQDDGTISFGFPAEIIPEGSSRYWLLTYDFSTAPTGGETFTVRVESAAAITASGQASGAPITAGGTFPISGGTRTLLGGLSIALGPQTPAATRAQPSSGDLPVLQLSLSAQGERFDVSRLRLQAAGSLDDLLGVAQVELWRDAGTPGVRDAADVRLAGGTFAADDGLATLQLNPAVALNAGTTERWLVTYDLSSAAQPGQTFRATLGAGELTAAGTLSGATTALGLPLSSATHAIGGSLSITSGPLSPAAGTLAPGQTRAAVLQVRLQTDLEPITVSALTVAGSGSGDEAAGLSSATLWVDANRNGVVDAIGDLQLGAARTFMANDGTITFTFADRTLPAAATEDWLVAYDLSAAAVAGQDFRAIIPNAAAFAARAPSGPLPGVTGAPVNGGVFTVLGALSLTRGTSTPPAGRVARGSSQVPVLQLTARATQEAFSISRLRVHAQGTLDDVGELLGVRLYRDTDGNGRVGAGDLLLSGPIAFTGDDGTVELPLSATLAPGGTETWLVAADFAPAILSGRTLRLSVSSAADVTATGWSSRAVTTIGGLPISSNTITVGGALEVRRGPAPLASRLVPRGTSALGALQLTVAADSEPATLTRLALAASGTGNDATGVAAVRLFHDRNADGVIDPGDTLLGTTGFTADDGLATFTLNEPVAVGAPIELLAVLDLSAAPIGGHTFRLSIDPATGVSVTSAAAAVTVLGAPITGPLHTVGGGFEVALAAGSGAGGPVNQSQQDLPVLALELFADNEPCRVTALTLTAAGSINDSTAISGVELWLDANQNGLVDFADTRLAGPERFAADDGVVSFAGLTRAIGRDARQHWLVVYDLSGLASDRQTLEARLARAADLSVRCDVSGSVGVLGAPVQGGRFTVEQDGALLLRRGDRTPPPVFLARGAVRAPLLQVRLRADVRDQTLDQLTFTVSSSNAAPNAALSTVELFVDTNHDGRLDRADTAIGTAAAPDAAGRASFTGLALPLDTSEAIDLLAVGTLGAGAAPGVSIRLSIERDADASARDLVGPVAATGAPVRGEVMTVAGDLNVAATGTSSVVAVHNDDEGRIVLRFDLAANSEAFTVESLTLTAEGTLDPASSISALRIVEDVDGDGLAGAADRELARDLTFPQGSTRLTASGLGAVLPAGSTSRWLVTADLAGTARVDQTFTLSLAANVDLIARGERAGVTAPIGAPITGPTLVIGPSLEVHPSAALADAIVAANAQEVPALALELRAYNEDVTVSRISLATSGSLDDRSGVRSVRLFHDANADGRIDPGDVAIAAPARPAGDDGLITFSPLSERVVRGGTRALLLVVDLSGSGAAGQDLRLALASNADLTAFGSLSGAIAATGAPITGPALSLVGALNVQRGPATPAGIGVNPGSSFAALQLELFTRGEAVTISQLELRLGGSADDAAVISGGELWIDRDGDGTRGEADQRLAAAAPDGDDGVLAFTGLSLSLDADAAERLLVTLDLAPEAATGGSIQVILEGNDRLRATGASSGAVTPVGAPIAGSTFTIVPALAPPDGESDADEGCSCNGSRSNDSGAGSPLLWLLPALLLVLRRPRRN